MQEQISNRGQMHCPRKGLFSLLITRSAEPAASATAAHKTLVRCPCCGRGVWGQHLQLGAATTQGHGDMAVRTTASSQRQQCPGAQLGGTQATALGQAGSQEDHSGCSGVGIHMVVPWSRVSLQGTCTGNQCQSKVS